MVSRTAIIAARLSASLFAAASLVLFTLILLKVMDYRFPSSQVFITAFPVIGTGTSIFWNLSASALITLLNYFVVLTFDILVAVVIVVLGVLGFVHDDISYLNNGLWLESNMMNASLNWLSMEISGIALLVISFFIQILVIVLTIWAREQKLKKTELEGPILPPPYMAKVDKDGFKEDSQSFASSGTPNLSIDEKKEKKNGSF